MTKEEIAISNINRLGTLIESCGSKCQMIIMIRIMEMYARGEQMIVISDDELMNSTPYAMITHMDAIYDILDNPGNISYDVTVCYERCVLKIYSMDIEYLRAE